MFRVRVKLACIILSSLIAIMATPPPLHATPPIGLDGIGRDIGLGHQSLTTTQPNDVIILIVTCDSSKCEGSISSVNDSNGLLFSLRVSFTAGETLWEYYAVAKSPLTSDNITIVSTVLSSGLCCVEMLVFGIHGANTSAIFDRSLSSPETVACPVFPNVETCSASATTSTIDMVIASVAINDAPACGDGVGGVPGFTTVDGAGGYLQVDFQIVRPRSNVTFSCVGFSDAEAIILDAVSFPSGFR